MEKIIGWIILIGVFIALFSATYSCVGKQSAILIWSIALIMCGLVVLASYLITK